MLFFVGFAFCVVWVVGLLACCFASLGFVGFGFAASAPLIWLILGFPETMFLTPLISRFLTCFTGRLEFRVLRILVFLDFWVLGFPGLWFCSGCCG